MDYKKGLRPLEALRPISRKAGKNSLPMIINKDKKTNLQGRETIHEKVPPPKHRWHSQDPGHPIKQTAAAGFMVKPGLSAGSMLEPELGIFFSPSPLLSFPRSCVLPSLNHEWSQGLPHPEGARIPHGYPGETKTVALMGKVRVPGCRRCPGNCGCSQAGHSRSTGDTEVYRNTDLGVL